MPGKLTGRLARLEDAAYIGPRLRDCDLLEVQALSEDAPAKVIHKSILLSPLCWTACYGDHPVFVIGCATFPDDARGCPWLLATNEVYRFPGALTRLVKGYVAEMMGSYPGLLNYVDERNVASVRWLARIGFTIEDALPLGLKGERFHPFHMGA